VGQVTALMALLGAGAGLGLVLVMAGLRPTTSAPPRRRHLLSGLRRDRLVGRLGLAAGAAVVIGALTGWPVAAVLAAAGGYALPTLLAGRGERTRQVARTEAIAGWAEMLRDTLSAAAGLEQAILATAPVAPIPIRTEVLGLAERLGSERLIPALRQFATELADPTGDLVVAALVLASGNEARRLAELLTSLATAARDQAAMQLRVEAGRARIRTSSRVVVGATLTFAGGLIILNRSFLSPFGTPVGQFMLGVIGLLFAGAFVWLARLGRPTVPERFLAAQTSAAR
jgi:Flp pilus assembly protein TadB